MNLKFTGDDGCEQNLPDQRRVLVQLRTSLFDRLDPVNAFWDPGKTLSPKVRDFISRYGVREVAVTTDAWGERRTLPESHAERTVIVVGDSITFGVLVDDSETLASQLQSRDPQHRYPEPRHSGHPRPRRAVRSRPRARAPTREGRRDRLHLLRERLRIRG